VNADLDCEQVLGRLATEPQARVRIAARRTDDGLWTYTMLDVVTGEAAVPRTWEYPTALFMEFDADGRDIAAALDECMIVHAGHRVTRRDRSALRCRPTTSKPTSVPVRHAPMAVARP